MKNIGGCSGKKDKRLDQQRQNRKMQSNAKWATNPTTDTFRRLDNKHSKPVIHFGVGLLF